MSTANKKTEYEPTCPICLEHFILPRRLPCAHTFCQNCLQSSITSEATEHEKLGYIECPVCRQTANPSKGNEPTSEWISLFPTDTVLQSMLPTKSKVDSVCEACISEGVSVTAEGFCAVCQEAMCGDCLKFHRKQKMSRSHTIISVEELSNNPQIVMKLEQGFTCSEYDGEYVQFYCRDHKTACCASCSFEKHKTCSKVVDFKKELTSLLQEMKPENIVDELKKVESHLKRFVELNELNINGLESQVNGLSDQIKEIRRKINIALDDLDTRIKTEGSRIYKEEVIRTQKENNQCLSLMHAVRNSCILLETVNKYGNDQQKFMMAEKMMLQLSSYHMRVKETCLNNEMISVQLELTPLIESLLSMSTSLLGKIVTTTKSENFSIQSSLKATQDCTFEKVDVIDVKLSSQGELLFYGVTFLPGDRVMLACNAQRQCILLSPSYEFITSYTLTGNPLYLCVMDNQEVAVSLWEQNEIQILSVTDDAISPVRTIKAQHKCCGIAAAGHGEMVVTGDCGNDKYSWSLISAQGKVTSSHQYDSPSGYFNCIAINSAKTRLYISMPSKNTLMCFNMEGKEQFTYNPSNLQRPIGVLVDRDNNIYVTVHFCSSIHHLSPDGSVLKIITTGVPTRPLVLCMDKSRDMFIATDYNERRKLHIYRLL